MKKDEVTKNIVNADKNVIEDKIKEVLADMLDIEIIDIGNMSSLKDNLGMDSFTALEFLAAIEQTFNIAINRRRISNVQTLQDVIGLVEKYLKKAKK